ncbi:MAG: DUF3520 domain-containing protein [Verrucomicrobia bacterium]|jgi:Ca-activated chloride channel homolog|nr:DUF3520 domain-containing protein [Verrucomicrobiota bacterium]MBT7067092.1 DUF3520 domain-containing protein [Verrucomicrobiota bacterium]MBT7700330.1 DUF3520 domain-containing protein [Verrucomicrobiota bacterium]
MNCDASKALLTLYVLNDLDATSAATVRTHLDSCPDCRAALQDIDSTLGLLRDALAAPTAAPQRLPASHRARIITPSRHTQAPIVSHDSWFTRHHRALAAAAALVFVCGMIGLMLPSLSSSRHITLGTQIMMGEGLSERDEKEAESAEGSFDGYHANADGWKTEDGNGLIDGDSVQDGKPPPTTQYGLAAKRPSFGSRLRRGREDRRKESGDLGFEVAGADEPLTPVSPPAPATPPRPTVPAPRPARKPASVPLLGDMPIVGNLFKHAAVDAPDSTVLPEPPAEPVDRLAVRATESPVIMSGGVVITSSGRRGAVVVNQSGGAGGGGPAGVNAWFSDVDAAEVAKLSLDGSGTTATYFEEAPGELVNSIDAGTLVDKKLGTSYYALGPADAPVKDAAFDGEDVRGKKRKMNLSFDYASHSASEPAPAPVVVADPFGGVKGGEKKTDEPMKPSQGDAIAMDPFALDHDGDGLQDRLEYQDGHLPAGSSGKYVAGLGKLVDSGAAKHLEDTLDIAEDLEEAGEGGRSAGDDLGTDRSRQDARDDEVRGMDGRRYSEALAARRKAVNTEVMTRESRQPVLKGRKASVTAGAVLLTDEIGAITDDEGTLGDRDYEDASGSTGEGIEKMRERHEVLSRALETIDSSDYKWQEKNLLRAQGEAKAKGLSRRAERAASRLEESRKAVAFQKAREEAQKREEEVEEEARLRFTAHGVNPFVVARKEPFSTFGIDVDTASYTLTRNMMAQGTLPPAEAVRTEEFVNAFDYSHVAPAHGTFRIYTELAPSPFGRGLQMLKIGVKGRRLGREEQRPAVLTFLVDTSGSMNSPERIGLVRSSLKLLVENLNPIDRVALIQYDSHARLLLEHTPASNKAQILQAIDRMQCSGSTNLEEGMNEAYRLAAGAFIGGAENRVLLLSDGVANLGNVAAEDILAKVATYRKQGIFCSVFGVGSGSYDDTMLETLANKGDGVYTFLDSEAEAKRVFVDDLAATLNTIASDVKIQVEFNPNLAKRYRQIGYENRKLKKQDFRNDAVDAGEVGSGQSVTALYEIDPHPELLAKTRIDLPPQKLATVRVRYRRIDNGRVEEIERAVWPHDCRAAQQKVSNGFRLAAGVAEFAEILRGSTHAKGSTYEEVADHLRPIALELHLDGRVQELLQMVTAAESTPRGE